MNWNEKANKLDNLPTAEIFFNKLLPLETFFFKKKRNLAARFFFVYDDEEKCIVCAVMRVRLLWLADICNVMTCVFVCLEGGKGPPRWTIFTPSGRPIWLVLLWRHSRLFLLAAPHLLTLQHLWGTVRLSKIGAVLSSIGFFRAPALYFLTVGDTIKWRENRRRKPRTHRLRVGAESEGYCQHDWTIGALITAKEAVRCMATIRFNDRIRAATCRPRTHTEICGSCALLSLIKTTIFSTHF